jgi:hypothetical protein
MTLAGTNVLLVGQNFHSTQTLTERLHRLKFRCHFAGNARAASDFMAARPVVNRANLSHKCLSAVSSSLKARLRCRANGAEDASPGQRPGYSAPKPYCPP